MKNMTHKGKKWKDKLTITHVFYEESCVNKHIFGVKVVEVNTH